MKRAKKVLITEDEFYALDGLPHLAIVLYITSLRPFMDYQTGITGINRGISYQSLSEELYVEPVPGRHKEKTGSSSLSTIRNAVNRLIQVGLLSIIPAKKKLIFKLNLAVTDNSDQSRSDRGTTDRNDRGTTQAQAALNNGFAPEQNHRNDRPNTHRSDTPPVSGFNNLNTTTTKDFKTVVKNGVVQGGGGGDFVNLIFPTELGAIEQQAIKKVLTNLDVQIAQQLIDELAGVMKTQTIINPVSYFHGINKRFNAGEFVPTAGVKVAAQRAKVIQERIEAQQRHQEQSKPREERIIDHEKTKAGREAMKAALKPQKDKST